MNLKKSLFYLFTIGFLTLMGCKEDSPEPVDRNVPGFLRSIYFYEPGSQWIYKCSDGSTDTIKVLTFEQNRIKMINSDNGEFMGTDEFFKVALNDSRTMNTHVYQKENSAFPDANTLITKVIYNNNNIPITVEGVILFYPITDSNLPYALCDPHTSALPACWTLISNSDTIINSEYRKMLKLLYTKTAEFGRDTLEQHLVEGIGMVYERNYRTELIRVLDSYNTISLK